MEAPPKKSWLPAVAAVVALLCVAAGGVFLLRGKIFKHPAEQASDSEETSSKDGGKKHPRVTHPIPTNTAWTLAFTNAVVPESAAVGSIHGSGFLCERSTLQGGVLNLRQGKNWPPDLGVTINMAARQGEDLANKTVEVGPERPPPVPKITMRWKDENDKAQTRNIPDGYALRVAFGPAENNRITGKIYLGLPDDEKSFVAGTFDAEIRKVTPPKPKSPKPAKPAGK